MCFLESVYVFQLSVSMGEAASEYPLYLPIYMIFYTFHIYVNLSIFLSHTYSIFNFIHTKRCHWPAQMDLVVITMREKSSQISTQIHTKMIRTGRKRKKVENKDPKKRRRKKTKE